MKVAILVPEAKGRPKPHSIGCELALMSLMMFPIRASTCATLELSEGYQHIQFTPYGGRDLFCSAIEHCETICGSSNVSIFTRGRQLIP